MIASYSPRPIFFLVLLVLFSWQAQGETLSLEALSERTHFHGVAFVPDSADQLYLATHHGFFRVGRDGQARRISEQSHDFMGFTPHPENPDMLFASGHPEGGGNLGVLVSRDGGQSWTQRATGADGPVDFHQLTISHADPDVLYGAYHGRLQVSRDGGHHWRIQASVPVGLVDLAGSARNPEHLYAATQSGLLMSLDAGQNWRPIHRRRHPVSMVETTSAGDIYAMMLGIGLIHTREGNDSGWDVRSDDWGETYLLHLAVDSKNLSRLVGVDNRSRILISENGGRDWAPW